MWGRQSYRWNREDFLANAKEGIGTPWPIGEDLAPGMSMLSALLA